MYLLDTDHISLMDRGGAEGQAIRARLKRVPPDDVVRQHHQLRGADTRMDVGYRAGAYG